MQQQKNLLLAEIQNLEKKASSKKNPPASIAPKQLIPAGTELYTSIKYNYEKGYPELILTTKNSAVIHGVVARSDKLFEKGVISL